MSAVRSLLGLVFLAVWHLGTSGVASAIDVEFNGGPVPRGVIAIYDSRHEKTPQTTRLHQFAEMPLNWLGLSLTYVDINGPLPAPETWRSYRGIVSWLVEPSAASERYLAWLDRATEAGLKLAVLSEMAPGAPASAARLSDRVHARLGLRTTTDYVSVTHRSKATIHTPGMAGFERPIDKALPDFKVMLAIEPRPSVHVSATIPGATATASVLIATNPAGGYAADEYTVVFDANTDRVRWTLNPFQFFKLALARDRMPVPDVTTLSGRRMYFSHIDGDGWNNVSQIEGYRQNQTLSADVIRREAIEPFPDLPVSVGVIAGDMQPDLGGNAAGQEVARKLYALPQVEVASHTHTHPFDWGFFEKYTRAQEEALIDKVRAPERPTLERVRRGLIALTGQKLPLDLDGRYVAGSSDLPRTYLKEPFDLKREVEGALAVSQSLAPVGKKAKLYLWSGNCLPFEAAIKASRVAGVRNLNGGDSRFDAEFPSVFYVPPIAKPVGAERQIYSGNSNENTYTNDWTGPYYGFSLLSETIRNTETPRRLKPFNIYYHMYSGERESALAALRQNLLLARSQSLTPVAASHYAAIADSFFDVGLYQTDVLSWNVANRRDLQTVRFDDADGLMVDMERSRGVIGSTRHTGGALYVALDPAVEPASITLMTQPAESVLPFTRKGADLVSARWQLRDVKAAEAPACGFSVTAEGFGAGEMLWQTAPGRRFDITAERDGREVAQTVATADASGAMPVTIKADAISPVRLRFTCNE